MGLSVKAIEFYIIYSYINGPICKSKLCYFFCCYTNLPCSLVVQQLELIV